MTDKKLSYLRFLMDCEKDGMSSKVSIQEFEEWMDSYKDFELKYCPELVEEDELQNHQ